MQIRNFSKIGDAIEAPDLAELQVAAYGRFLQPDLLPHQRQPVGLEAIFREIFPIVAADGQVRMEYLGYELGLPYRSEEECRHLGSATAARCGSGFGSAASRVSRKTCTWPMSRK